MTGRRERGVDLERMKADLKAREAAKPPARKAAPAPRPKSAALHEAAVARPEPPASFDDEMKRLGVEAAPTGPQRAPLPAPSDGPRSRASSSSSGAPEIPADLDDEALWALSTRGVVAQGQGVARKDPERSEALPTLDLHGFSEEDAIFELRRFVQLHRASEPRWVRVITGRGVHGPGVVRRATVAWLQPNAAIAGFTPAPKDQGGTGVLLVQLKRRSR